MKIFVSVKEWGKTLDGNEKKNPLTNNSQKQENRFFSTRIFCYLVSAIQPTNTDNHSHKTQLDLFRIGLKNFRKYLKITQKVG